MRPPTFLAVLVFVFAWPLRAQEAVPATDSSAATLSSEQQEATDSLAATDTAVTIVEEDTAQSRTNNDGVADTLRYEADRIHYDIEAKILHLYGNAVSKYGNLSLYADTIEYRINENLFMAYGSPQLVEGTDTTVGEFMTYNIKTKRGRVRYATTHMTDAYFSGNEVIKTAEPHLYVEDGDYTSCAYLEEPHYYFYTRYLKIVPNDKAISRPVVLNIGEAPVAALPYFVMPLERGRQSGWLTPGWGGNVTSGGYVDNVGFYWAPNDYMDWKVAAKVQEFEEFVFTGVGRYALKYWLGGRISARYALDTDYKTQRRNWALDYSHHQNITPDGLFTLSGRGNLVNSRTFYTSFSEEENELLNRNVTANLSLSKRMPRLNASLNLNWDRTHDLETEHVREDLPSMTFGLSDRPIIPHKTEERFGQREAEEDEPTWFNKIYYNYNGRAVVKRDVYLNDSLPGFIRPGMSNTVGLRAPQKIFRWFNITPSFNAGISTFYGFMDTGVVRYDTLYDTLRYTVPDPRLDTLYDTLDYPLVDESLHVELDTINEMDTVYHYTRISPPHSFAVYDTFPDSLAHDYWWNAGLGLSTHLYGLFPIKIFNFAGVRHTLSPSVSYTFTPRHEQDKRFFPIGIGARSPTKKPSQSVRISVGNLFQGKTIKESDDPKEEPEENKFTMLTSNISAAYDFEKKRRKWSDLNLSASTTLKLMRISYNSSFWLYDEDDHLSAPILRSYSINVSPNNFAASGTFWGGDLLVLENAEPDNPVEYWNAGPQQWRINLSPSFSFTKSRATPSDVFVPTKRYNLSASASINFTRNWSMSWSSRFDFVKNDFIGHTLNFRCDMECWDLRFDWSPSGINPRFYFKVQVKKIPEIKWEKRSR